MESVARPDRDEATKTGLEREEIVILKAFAQFSQQADDALMQSEITMESQIAEIGMHERCILIGLEPDRGA
jgi:hypothetical protein